MLLKDITLLFVEDDRDSQEQIKILLEDDFKEFYQAYDGEEGFTLYQEKHPDIIITDLNMPLLNGLDMLKRIKDHNENQAVLIISALDDSETLLEAINLGINGFIVKPLDIELLEKKLRQIAESIEHKKRDENAVKEKIETLCNLAHYDSLTNIANRFLFERRLEQAISSAQRNDGQVTLFFIDLDNFKRVNDSFGHSAGDNVLTSVVNNIQSVIRNEDILARVGGDEFSLIIEGRVDKEYLDILAKKILKASSKSVTINGSSIDISCSIGICRFPQESSSKQELVEFADKAMYRAKSSGKSTYSYFEGNER